MKPLYNFIHVPKTAGTTFGKSVMENNMKSIRYPRGNIPPGGWNSYDGIHGHCNSNLADIRGHFQGREIIYFTFLREPIRRLMSYYYFVDHNISIEEWLVKNGDSLRNRMVKYYSSADDLEHLTEVHLERAKRFLDICNIGVVEKFDESLKRFQKKFPIFKNLNYEYKNRSKKEYSFDSESDNVKGMLNQYNDLDIELYRYGLRIFENKLS